MIPVIAIVGRPNVGKSTLFNCLTKSRDALVIDLPGVTRDRKYGEGIYNNNRFIVIDTGGIESELQDEIHGLIEKQSLQAIHEASVIFFVVDANEGLTLSDERIAHTVRQASKPVFLVVNKSESKDPEIAKLDFYRLGFENVAAISAAHCRGIPSLITQALAYFPKITLEESKEEEGIKIAVIGRPNVGKSTLVNRILGEERVVVCNEPGTTRDSIFIPFIRNEEKYILIDTAGVRRRTKITEEVEKFSVIKTLQTIEAANVIIFILNSREGISDQDLRLLDFVIEAGKSLVVAINKWDGLETSDKIHIRAEIDRRLEFVSFARKYFISALHGTGVGDLFPALHEAYTSATKKLPTPLLTRILESAVKQHQPPLIHGRRIKLRYAHAGGQNPPIIVIHGNQTESLPLDYSRYLINFFRKKLKLVGTPIKIELKSGENPYQGRKNILTPRQRHKKQRLLKHIKKHKKK